MHTTWLTSQYDPSNKNRGAECAEGKWSLVFLVHLILTWGFSFDFHLLKTAVKKRKKKKKKTNRLSLILFIALSLSVFFLLSFLPREKQVKGNSENTLEPEISDTIPLYSESKEIIPKGATLSDILSRYNFLPAEIHKLRKEVIPVFDLARIKAGNEIRITSTEEGKFKSLEYDIDDGNYLLIYQEEENFKAEIKKIPYRIEMTMIWGIIEDNLISAVTKQNEKNTLAISLAELFSWDIDFYADLRQGDTFKIIFEKKYINDRFVSYRNILAAEFTNQGKTYQAFRYIYPDTKKWDFFDSEGNSLRKEFLKSPIGSARITSRFSFSRLHPIYKIYRPHFGVDYAARIGTPVQATADGIVTFTGWNGASGRMVRIRHKNNYETLYLHLRSFAQGIKKGARVSGGQEIGYVGSSGESTGPHLDYRIKYREKYINPLAWKFKPVQPLRTEFKEDFKILVGSYQLSFEAPLFLPSFIRRSIHPVLPVWLSWGLP